MGLPQQRDLIEGCGLVDLAVGGCGGHGQRMDDRLFRRTDPLDQPLFLELVHEEADRTAVHPVDRLGLGLGAVQGLQHEAVAAQGDDHIRISLGDHAVAGLQLGEGGPGFRAFAGDEGQSRGGGGHGPSKREARRLVKRRRRRA